MSEEGIGWRKKGERGEEGEVWKKGRKEGMRYRPINEGS